MSAQEANKTPIPSEYKLSDKWDKCLENFALNFSAGLVAGGLTSLVLARGRGGRLFVTGFGTGAGTGSSWTTCSMAFNEDKQALSSLEKTEAMVKEVKQKFL